MAAASRLAAASSIRLRASASACVFAGRAWIAVDLDVPALASSPSPSTLRGGSPIFSRRAFVSETERESSSLLLSVPGGAAAAAALISADDGLGSSSAADLVLTPPTPRKGGRPSFARNFCVSSTVSSTTSSPDMLAQ